MISAQTGCPEGASRVRKLNPALRASKRESGEGNTNVRKTASAAEDRGKVLNLLRVIGIAADGIRDHFEECLPGAGAQP